MPLQGTASALVPSPASLDFGSHSVGSHTTQTVTVTNAGKNTVAITGTTIQGGNSGDFSRQSSCGSGLAAGQSCTISVTFTPQKTGSRSSTLVIRNLGGVHLLDVPLSGTGT